VKAKASDAAVPAMGQSIGRSTARDSGSTRTTPGTLASSRAEYVSYPFPQEISADRAAYSYQLERKFREICSPQYVVFEVRSACVLRWSVVP
jgi:hypothetical protein